MAHLPKQCLEQYIQNRTLIFTSKHGINSYVPHQLNNKFQIGNKKYKMLCKTLNYTDNEHIHFETEKIQEDWMILSDFHSISSSLSDTSTSFANSLQYWQLQSDNYTQKQISEMPNWINAQKNSFQELRTAFSRCKHRFIQ